MRYTQSPQPRKQGLLEHTFVKFAPWLLLLAALLLVVSLIQLGKTNYAVKETSAYTRVSNCIVAKVANPPTTQDDIEKCYQQVEKDSGISLERFDMQVNNEKAEK